MPTAVTSIINVHAEGSMAQPAIESMLAAAKLAALHGVEVQTLVVADRVTRDTMEAMRPYRSRIRVEHVDVGDPGLARNLGAEIADSEYVSFFDGDDLAGETWLYNAYRTARKNPNNIVHPQLAIHFGDKTRQHICEFAPMTARKIGFLIYANLFPSVQMSRRSVCLAVPYRKSDLRSGFGYEDWAWNCDTIRGGYRHVIAEGTIFFCRRKQSGSLSLESVSRKCLPLPSPRFFDKSVSGGRPGLCPVDGMSQHNELAAPPAPGTVIMQQAGCSPPAEALAYRTAAPKYEGGKSTTLGCE